MDVVNTTPIRPVNLLDRGTGENIPESQLQFRIAAILASATAVTKILMAQTVA